MRDTGDALAFLRDPRLAAHATSATPAWLWSSDARRIVWANPVGAAVFDAPTPAALAQREFAANHAPADQIARLAGTLRPGGSPQLERLRGFGGPLGRPLTCSCSRITLADHTAAILVVATEPAGPALAMNERVRRLFEGAGIALAAFTPDGLLLHATPEGDRRLGAHGTLAALGADAVAEEALAHGEGSGHTALGHATIVRLGTGASAVLVAALPELPAAPAETTAATPAGAQRPPPARAGHDMVPATPGSEAPPADRRPPLRFVWQTDAVGHCTLASDEFLQLLGPRVSTALGSSWTKLNAELALDPDDQVARAVATRDTWSGITVSWPVEGTADRLRVELSGLPIYDRNRNFQGYRGFGVCRDLERIATLAELRRSAPQMGAERASPAESTPASPAPPTSAAVASPGADHDIRPMLTVVPSAPNVVPFRSSAPAADVKGPALSPIERNAFHELARELTARLKDGAGESGAEAGAESPAPPAEARIAAARMLEAASLAAAARVETDVKRVAAADTARQLADARAAELHAMLDALSEGILMLTLDGCVVAANRSAAALFGGDAATLAGRSLADLLAPESRQAVRDDLADVARRDGETPHAGREVSAGAGERGTVALSMRLTRIPGAERICAVFHDLRERRAAERELAAAQDAAERASAARSEILAKISHELRTPLNSILGFTEVMLDERFGPIGNERYREYLKDIRGSGEHALALLGDLFDLSKIAAGKLELAFAELNLNDTVQDCVAFVQPQANRERIIIRTALAHALPPVLADARTVRQIALNLLATSIKLTGAGGQVIVSTAQSGAGEPVLRVRDTGIGLDDRDLAAALEPFRPMATSPRSNAIGTGLSLPLTKALAEANRARFAISSKVNGGTLVEVTFAPARPRAA